MDNMYIRGVLSSAYEERGSIAVLHIIDEDVISKVIKDTKIKKHKIIYDDIACEFMLITGEIDKMRKLLDKQPVKDKDYFAILRGAIDASCAEIYGDKIEIRLEKEMAKDLKTFLKKHRINSTITNKNNNIYLQIKGHSLDKVVANVLEVQGVSKTSSRELKNFAKV